jgi:hypothetical protein
MVDANFHKITEYSLCSSVYDTQRDPGTFTKHSQLSSTAVATSHGMETTPLHPYFRY